MVKRKNDSWGGTYSNVIEGVVEFLEQIKMRIFVLQNYCASQSTNSRNEETSFRYDLKLHIEVNR